MTKKLKYLGVALLVSVVFTSCANRGSGPQGGPIDELPPVMLECTPQERATNVDRILKKGIKMEFNENVAVKDAYKHVIISPPSKNRPVVKAQNKNIITTFEDTLKENTTYTIQYGDALVDNNEGNPIRGYTYVFSTGPVIDSMYIDGYIINAQTLAPIPDMVAGIYPDAVDTTFTTTTFFRVAKTDSTGYFRIQNIPDGNYSLYGLNDPGGDWFYSQKQGGTVAFWDETIRPKLIDNGQLTIDNDSIKNDSIKNDSLKTDTVNYQLSTFNSEKPYVLRMFTEKRTQQYFKKALHPNREMFILVFGSEPSMIPELKVLELADSIAPRTYEPFIFQKTERKDSLVYWVTDTTLLKNDTLRLQMTYMKTDSLENLVQEVDTLNLRVAVKKRSGSTRKKNTESTDQKPVFINITHNVKDRFEIPDTLTLNFAEPIKSIIYDSIRLGIKVDTTFKNVPIRFMLDDTICTKEMKVVFEKKFGETYRFDIDSAAIVSIYGHHNDKFYKTFAMKKIEDYSNLYVTFKENPADAVFELMDENEKVKYRSILEDGEVTFQDIIPGNYYLRMFIDSNHNGEWDTGNVHQHIQPEEVYYMNLKLNLPANWDIEQTWDYKSFSPLNQRPGELKGKDGKSKKR